MQVSNSVGLYVPSGGAYPSVHFRQNRGKNQKPKLPEAQESVVVVASYSAAYLTGQCSVPQQPVSYWQPCFKWICQKKISYMAYLDVLLHEGTVLLRHDLILTWQNVP